MARRPTPEELRFVLEQFADPRCNATSLASLKRIIENHIGALEILHAIERVGAKGAYTADLVRLGTDSGRR
jgi:hypothetical protein